MRLTHTTASSTRVLTNGAGDIVAASIRLNRVSELSAPRIMARELLHALGFGNTCKWQGVTAPSNCVGSDRPTADDAAAFELAYFIRTAVLQGRATTSLRDAMSFLR